MTIKAEIFYYCEKKYCRILLNVLTTINLRILIWTLVPIICQVISRRVKIPFAIKGTVATVTVKNKINEASASTTGDKAASLVPDYDNPVVVLCFACLDRLVSSPCSLTSLKKPSNKSPLSPPDAALRAQAIKVDQRAGAPYYSDVQKSCIPKVSSFLKTIENTYIL